jgi:peptidoglycan pentaglycine glycine transferase (the first glycine)
MKFSSTKESWDAKAIDLGGSILQSWEWGRFQNSLGFKPHYFAGDNYLNLVLELPMPFGKKYLYSAKGPIGDESAALNDLTQLAASDHSIVFARLEPSMEMSLPKAAKDTQPTHSWILDLEKSDDDLLAAMKPKHRYNLNLARKKGVTVRQGTKEDILTVWQLLLETASRNKFRLHPQNYYWQIYEHLHSDYLSILIAEYQGKALSVMLMTTFGNTATYLHGGSSNSNKEIMAPYLLHWEAIKHAKQKGYKFYDFGGIAPENEPNHSWAGITRFKKGFGGFELTTPGAFDLVFSPLWYNVYKNARKFKSILKPK